MNALLQCWANVQSQRKVGPFRQRPGLTDKDIAMPSFLQLPGGLPWWASLAILVPVALYGLLLLAMPFSVFGIKGRLDHIEMRLDEIQEEIRGLAFRFPEPSRQAPVLPPAHSRATPLSNATLAEQHEPTRPYSDSNPRKPMPERGERFEPRLDWPR